MRLGLGLRVGVRVRVRVRVMLRLVEPRLRILPQLVELLFGSVRLRHQVALHRPVLLVQRGLLCLTPAGLLEPLQPLLHLDRLLLGLLSTRVRRAVQLLLALGVLGVPGLGELVLPPRLTLDLLVPG